MRLLDVDTDRAISNICVYLTPAEAKEMLGSLEELVGSPETHHFHLDDAEYKHEISIAVYSDQNMSQFDERSKRLIVDGT